MCVCVHISLSQNNHPHNLQCPEIIVKYEHQRENANISPGSDTQNAEIQTRTYTHRMNNSWRGSEKYLNFEQARSVAGWVNSLFHFKGPKRKLPKSLFYNGSLWSSQSFLANLFAMKQQCHLKRYWFKPHLRWSFLLMLLRLWAVSGTELWQITLFNTLKRSRLQTV